MPAINLSQTANIAAKTYPSSSRLISNTPWTRPAGWLSITAPTESEQKFVGLHRVSEDGSNFCALAAAGNYTINWGDGSGDTNVTSGGTSSKNIAYTDASASSDAGIVDAVACTFTDSGDTIGLTAHGWSNGQKVAFNTITSTTGITVNTTYYIVGASTDGDHRCQEQEWSCW